MANDGRASGSGLQTEYNTTLNLFLAGSMLQTEQVDQFVNFAETGAFVEYSDAVVDPNVFVASNFLIVEYSSDEAIPTVPIVPPRYYENVSLSLESIVTTKDLHHPSVGLFSVDNQPTGWKYDHRTLVSKALPSTSYRTYTDGFSTKHLQDVSKDNLESFVVNGCSLIETIRENLYGNIIWNPKVAIGSYSILFDQRKLFSDYAVTTRVAEPRDAFFYEVELENEFYPGTIEVAVWKRHANNEIFKFKEFVLNDLFTGEIDEITSSRKETYDGTNHITANIDLRKNEYIIENNSLLIPIEACEVNRYYLPSSVVVGDLERSLMSALIEDKGFGQVNSFKMHTQYFPLKENTVRVFRVNGSGNVFELTEVTNLSESTLEDEHFAVDYDLGIIKLVHKEVLGLLLEEAIDDSDNEIRILNKDLLALCPESGVIELGDELLYFAKKTSSGFELIDRGYDSTTATAHAIGAECTVRQQSQSSTDQYFVSYKAVPRVQYEITNHVYRTTNNYAQKIDSRPTVNAESNTILQIASEEKHVSALVLETSSLPINSNINGPVFYGLDISRLTATALNLHSEGVEDVAITFKVISGSGYLNSNKKEYTTVSNSLGETYSYYNSPYHHEDMFLTVKTVSHDGLDTLMNVENLSPGNSLDEITIYEVLKHDKTFGSIGLKSEVIDELAVPSELYGSTSLVVNSLLHHEDFRNGRFIAIGSDGIQYVRTILYATAFDDGTPIPKSILYIKESLPAGVFLGENCQLLAFDEVEWLPEALNGVKVVLYHWSTDVEHPTLGTPGAYTPYLPSAIEDKTLRFANIHLPLPEPSVNSNNLGAYKVVASEEVQIQAECLDPMTGLLIQSNIIKLKVTLPKSLLGVNYNLALPIPYGFTFINQEFEYASGLGGSNFVTINPLATGINQFSLRGDL